MTHDHPSLTRRDFLTTAGAIVASAGVVPMPLLAIAEESRGPGTPPSLPEGTFLNPIFRGDYPDAGVLRVGDDYYITHSSFVYAPGLIVWHSKDLVHWQPVCAALTKYHGDIWAPYLCEHKGRYFIYYPCNGRLTVVHAASPRGPWSEPVDLGIRAIDPAHMASTEGKRYMFFAGGRICDLADDGLSVTSPVRRNFDPWAMPMDWNIECTCLEAPKLFKRGDYYYLTVAQGGTSGPSTSHSVISARSKSIEGPWEYSPHNPIVRTKDRSETWWSKGHGRPVEAADGSWWMTFHAYENGFRSLGRRTLLVPLEWTADNWFRVPPAVADDSPIPMPKGAPVESPASLSDDFTSDPLRLQWQFWKHYDPQRFKTGNGTLVLNAHGTTLADTSVLTCMPGERAYTVEVDVEIAGNCEAGLVLFYNSEHNMGLRVGPAGIGFRQAGDRRVQATRALFRIINDQQEAAFFWKIGNQPWARVREGFDLSHYDTNNYGSFLDLRPALFAMGQGTATFRSFRLTPAVVNPFTE